LPQIAQERAMLNLENGRRWEAAAGRPQRGGMIAHGLDAPDDADRRSGGAQLAWPSDPHPAVPW
jgi:hypothetical protein